jgi:hypothetical protein
MENQGAQSQRIERKTAALASVVAGLAWGLTNETGEEFRARCQTIERIAREIENDTSVLREWMELERSVANREGKDDPPAIWNEDTDQNNSLDQ